MGDEEIVNDEVVDDSAVGADDNNSGSAPGESKSEDDILGEPAEEAETVENADETPESAESDSDIDSDDSTLDDIAEEKEEVEDTEFPVEPNALLAKSIHKDFPELFKKYPQVKSSLFQVGQYRSHFPSPKEAEAAVGKINFYEKLDRVVSSGDLKPIVETLRKNNPAALEKIAENFITNLSDSKLANLVAEPVIRQGLQLMLEEGQRIKSSGGKPTMEIAARWAINHFYGKTELPTGKLGGRVEDPEIEKQRANLAEREQALIETQFSNFQTPVIGDMKSTVDRQIRATIDPEKKMSKFVLEAAVEKAHKMLESQLERSESHLRTMSNLWDQARRDLSIADKMGPKIKSAFMGSAKPYLPVIVSKIRAQILGKSSLNTPEKKSNNGNANAAGQNSGGVNRGVVAAKSKNTAFSGGGSSGGSNGGVSLKKQGINPRDINYRRTTEDDIISGKVKLHK